MSVCSYQNQNTNMKAYHRDDSVQWTVASYLLTADVAKNEICGTFQEIHQCTFEQHILLP